MLLVLRNHEQAGPTQVTHRLPILKDKQVAHIGRQTGRPYWGTNRLPLLGDKQVAHIEGQTGCPHWGTNRLPLLRDKHVGLIGDKQIALIWEQTGSLKWFSTSSVLSAHYIMVYIFMHKSSKQFHIYLLSTAPSSGPKPQGNQGLSPHVNVQCSGNYLTQTIPISRKHFHLKVVFWVLESNCCPSSESIYSVLTPRLQSPSTAKPSFIGHGGQT